MRNDDSCKAAKFSDALCLLDYERCYRARLVAVLVGVAEDNVAEDWCCYRKTCLFTCTYARTYVCVHADVGVYVVSLSV